MRCRPETEAVPRPADAGFFMSMIGELEMSAFMRIARGVKKAYDEGKTAKPAPAPAPPRQQRRAEPAAAKPSTSPRAKANQAADMLRVPGRNVIRKGMAQRKKMLDDL